MINKSEGIEVTIRNSDILPEIEDSPNFVNVSMSQYGATFPDSKYPVIKSVGANPCIITIITNPENGFTVLAHLVERDEEINENDFDDEDNINGNRSILDLANCLAVFEKHKTGFEFEQRNKYHIRLVGGEEDSAFHDKLINSLKELGLTNIIVDIQGEVDSVAFDTRQQKLFVLDNILEDEVIDPIHILSTYFNTQFTGILPTNDKRSLR